jgi:hypothetical protein
MLRKIARILFSNQHQLFFVALHFSGGVFVVQNMLARLEGGLHKRLLLDLLLRIPIVDKVTRAHGEDLSFPGFLSRGVRNDNAAGALLAWLAGSDQDPIVQRPTRGVYQRCPHYTSARYDGSETHLPLLMTSTLSKGTPKCTVPTGYPAAWYLAKYVPRSEC